MRGSTAMVGGRKLALDTGRESAQVRAVCVALAITLSFSVPSIAAPPEDTTPQTQRRETPGARDELPDDPRIAFHVAENTFRYQDYARAVGYLDGLLYPDVRLDEPEELRAREYLGASLWFQQDYERAEEEFTSLLTRTPEHELDSFYYPASLISFFETVRQKLIRLRIIQIGPDEPPDDPTAPGAARLVQERLIERRSRALCFVPFGVGQFHNGDVGMGVAFLTVETVALATNIASFFVIQSLREESGFIAPRNMKTARTYEKVLYASLGVFAAAAVAGIIEALVSFEPEVETIRLLPDGPSPPAEPVSRRGGFSWGLTGVGFHVQF